MNEREKPKTKICRKHENETEFSEGYCPQCYPFPRVYCIGCEQPLTSLKHRLRQEGARCYQARIKKEKMKHMKEYVPFVRTINRTEYSDLGDMF